MTTFDRAIRLSVTLAVVLLALIAFSISFQHAYALGLQLGEPRSTAQLVPLTIDGLLVTAALVGLFASRYGLGHPALARYALGLGIAATLTVNVAEGASRGFWSAVFSGWPAIALLISAELLLWLVGAWQQLSTKALIVIDTDKSDDMGVVASLLAAEPTMSAAEIGRRTGLRYEEALRLAKQARALLAGSR